MTALEDGYMPSLSDLAACRLAADCTVWERRMKALSMHLLGQPNCVIAQEISRDIGGRVPRGYDERYAERDWRAAIKDVVRIPLDEMVDDQRARTMALIATYMPDAVDPLLKDKDAAKLVLDCETHEAKLFGLYAPTRVNVGVSDTEFGAQAAQLIHSPAVQAALRDLAGLPREISAAPVYGQVAPSRHQVIEGEVLADPMTPLGPDPLSWTDSDGDQVSPVASPEPANDGWSNL